MAAYIKINDLAIDFLNGVHNGGSHTFKYALSNTAPASETSNPTATGNGQLANVTQIAYTNLAEDRTISGTASAQVGDDATFDGDQEVLTASGGSVGPFQYVYLYNDTATGDPLLGAWDYGSSITLQDGETFTLTIPTVLLNILQA